MADGNYIGYYYDEETGKEGIEIAARDCIILNASEILFSPDVQLLTQAQDLAGALNEIAQKRGYGTKK